MTIYGSPEIVKGANVQNPAAEISCAGFLWGTARKGKILTITMADFSE
jgi:hypothetical protein